MNSTLLAIATDRRDTMVVMRKLASTANATRYGKTTIDAKSPTAVPADIDAA